MNLAGDWDDSLILKVFNEAIISHRTQGQPKPAASSSQSDQRDVHFADAVQQDARVSVHKRKRNDTSAQQAPPSSSSSHSSHQQADLTASYNASNTRQGILQDQSAGESNWPGLPAMPCSGNPAADDALQTMLMAWYQCGYATARYQTLLEVGVIGPAAGSEAGGAQEAEDGEVPIGMDVWNS